MDVNKHKKVLIVGQGIAGTLFSFLCHKNGISCDVVDNDYKNSASMVSSGIINPVTGKRYVKSWQFEELKEYFLPMYKELSDLLEEPFIREMESIVVLHSAEAMNFWDARKGDPGYEKYLSDDPDIDFFREFIREKETGKIRGSYQIAIRKLLNRWREFLRLQNAYIVGEVDVKSILEESEIIYRGTQYDKIVLCTGAEARKTGLWDEIPFDPLKGEVIIDRSRDFSSKYILKRKYFFVPLPDGSLWIGATYDREFGEDEGITHEAREGILKTVEDFLDFKPRVDEHLAALRPTVRDRRPVVGRHPNKENVYILNGFGTKGMSLGPYCATQLYEFIFHETKLPEEIDLMRFYR